MTENEGKDGKDPRTGRFLPGHARTVKHGAYSLRQFRLPLRGVKALERHLAGMRGRLEAEAEPTAKSAILIAQVIGAEEKLSLIDAWLKRSGIIRKDRALKGTLELQPVIREAYVGLLNTQRLALQALGLKKPDEGPMPWELDDEEDNHPGTA